MYVKLPSSDDVLERHQYYAAVGADIATLHDKDKSHHESIHRVHERMDKMSEDTEVQKVEQIKTETRNRTLAAAVVVAWTVISGVFSWAWDKSASKVELFSTKFEKVEKDFTEMKVQNTRLKEDLDKAKEDLQALSSVRRTVTTIQEQITKLEENNNKTGKK